MGQCGGIRFLIHCYYASLASQLTWQSADHCLLSYNYLFLLPSAFPAPPVGSAASSVPQRGVYMYLYLPAPSGY